MRSEGEEDDIGVVTQGSVAWAELRRKLQAEKDHVTEETRSSEMKIEHRQRCRQCKEASQHKRQCGWFKNAFADVRAWETADSTESWMVSLEVARRRARMPR